MIELEHADIGRRVSYRPGKHQAPEYGIVTSFNASFVFVLYDGGRRSMATPYHRLAWAGPRLKHPPDWAEKGQGAIQGGDAV